MAMRVSMSKPASEAPGTSPVPDAVLVTHAQHDRRAFEPLYQRYFDPIFRFCYFRLRDWQEAEDATSDVFASALANLTRFSLTGEPDGFRCWLFTIARNMAANRRRHHARHPQVPLNDTWHHHDHHASPEEIAIAADEHQTLLHLLSQVRPEQRELLELRLVGLNDAEIARVLGRSHDAVRKEQSRTIARLRALVRDHPEVGVSHER